MLGNGNQPLKQSTHRVHCAHGDGTAQSTLQQAETTTAMELNMKQFRNTNTVALHPASLVAFHETGPPARTYVQRGRN